MPVAAGLGLSTALAANASAGVGGSRTLGNDARGGSGALFISEYRVLGARSLTPLEIETAVYRFLGPDRTLADVKSACAALEKIYTAKGFAATAQYRSQMDPGGIVHIDVTEGTVARLRVKGARYFSLAKIKEAAPSVAPGQVLNFNDVNRDIVALNQLRDRTVTPTLAPGHAPGTYDIELDVKDSAPVHANVELNNQSTPNTTPLRFTGGVSDSNLWQAGNGAGFSFEVAPKRRRDSEVFSGYYLARFAGLDRFSLMVTGTKQDSNISTLGGATVAGPGQTAALQATLNLPNGTDWDTGKPWLNFYHSVSVGVDYKHYNQTITTAASASGTSSASAGTIVTPLTYYPLTATYTATLDGLGGAGSVTQLNAGVAFHFRGLGSSSKEFNLNRYGADGNFIYLRGDLSHEQKLPMGFQIFAKLQGQIASAPLVSSEEFSGGGVGTVRGYLESEAVGDNGIFGTLELRTPSVLWRGKKKGDWSFYAFGDAGELSLLQPLPEQQSRFKLASVGLGTRIELFNHLSGGCDAAYPLETQTYTQARNIRVTFRVGVDY